MCIKFFVLRKGFIISIGSDIFHSSSVCRLSAVGLGWDRAFGAVDDMGVIDEDGKRWVEIDNRAQIMPVWQPFELFIH